ncbi:Golgi reassembly-stacking protein 2 [Mortierella polycephala]|uniref:Golgi reassembly-stacking protein 2 n=1 Tax=Mortierella polycephala TaxID=41804 RepID=A0A9P6PUS1_9FUNG|nr:Golgi reassembly-stacking protein 2 [Mortierella polycephala]
MGNSTSGDEGRHRNGYHVLRVKEDSPADKAGLRPFFDYIVAVNNIRLNTESATMREQMEACEDKTMILDVYSTKEQKLRRIEMTPTRNWGDGEDDSLLGCSIRFDLFDTILDVVWHVLDVKTGSPAEQSGLCAHRDYVIGTPLGIMRAEGDLYDLVEDYMGEPLPLHVYNLDTNQVREVIIVPSESWGGEGLLGCDVGYGYLHRLPIYGSLDFQNPAESTNPLPKETTVDEEKPDPAKDEPQDDTVVQVETQNPAADLETEKSSVSDAASDIVMETVTPRNDSVSEPRIQDSTSLSQSQDGDQQQQQNGTCSHIPITPPSPTATTHVAENSQLTSPPPPASCADVPTRTLATNDSITNTNGPADPTKGKEPVVEDGVKSSTAEDPMSTAVSSNQTSESTQVENETPHEGPRQPPLAIAARMRPGIHGRGIRVGHDGHRVRDRIPLAQVQAQAEQQSAEYKDQKEKNPTPPVHPNQGQDKEGEGHQTDVDPEVHDFVVEGMIRNMALGSSVFLL